MNIEKMLAECRAHWEKTRPDAVFADYWLGWLASRESLVIDLPNPPKNLDISDRDINGMCAQFRKDEEAIEAAGLKVKS